MVRIFVDNRFEFPGAQVFVRVIAQVQNDFGAALGLGDGLDFKLTGASAAPAHALFSL